MAAAIPCSPCTSCCSFPPTARFSSASSPHPNKPFPYGFSSCALPIFPSPPFPLRNSRLPTRQRQSTRSMAPDEEKMTRRSPLDFPIEWERPRPGRRPDIFPQFSPLKTPLPQPLPADPPEEDEEEEEKKEEEQPEEDQPEKKPET